VKNSFISLLSIFVSVLFLNVGAAQEYKVVKNTSLETHISITGVFKQNDYQNIISSLGALKSTSPKHRRFLYLDSPGGDYFVGIALADTVRNMGFTTIVRNQCNSACVFVFMAGRHYNQGVKHIGSSYKVSRIVYRGATIGIHRISSNKNLSTQVAQAIIGNAVRSFNESDFRDSILIEKLLMTDSNDLYILSEEDMIRNNISIK